MSRGRLPGDDDMLPPPRRGAPGETPPGGRGRTGSGGYPDAGHRGGDYPDPGYFGRGHPGAGDELAPLPPSPPAGGTGRRGRRDTGGYPGGEGYPDEGGYPETGRPDDVPAAWGGEAPDEPGEAEW